MSCNPTVAAPDPESYEAPGVQLSAGRASQLEMASWEVVPGLFQALVSYGRPLLFELGCDADSLISTTVQTATNGKSGGCTAPLNLEWGGPEFH